MIQGRGCRSCRYALGQFSPDGRYVLGHPPSGDGSGHTSLAILDAATGHVVAEVRNDAQTQAHVNTAVWDKDDTVLATVYEQGTWSVMRLGLDGALTSVSGPGLPAELAGGDDTTPPLRFSARP